MLQVVRMGCGVQAGAGQLVEGRGEQGAEASAGASVGEMDGMRRQGWRVSIGSSSPAGIARSFFSSGAVLTARLLTCCILIYWSASIGTIACSFAWQDDPTLLIDEWVH